MEEQARRKVMEEWGLSPSPPAPRPGAAAPSAQPPLPPPHAEPQDTPPDPWRNYAKAAKAIGASPGAAAAPAYQGPPAGKGKGKSKRPPAAYKPQDPEAKGMDICPYIMKGEECDILRQNKACNFWHPKVPPGGICGRFQYLEGCEKGQYCQFGHIALGSEDAKRLSEHLRLKRDARRARDDEEARQQAVLQASLPKAAAPAPNVR